jgi:hypothetical protein
MPKGKTITRTDNPDKVRMFGKGGSTKDEKSSQDDPTKRPIPREEPSRPMTKKEVEQLRPKPASPPPRVPDRTFRGESERGDDMVPRPKYAKGGKAKFIQGAIKKPGALHAQLGVPKDKKIPAKALAKAAKAPGKLGQRARFAQLLKGMRKK